MKIRHFHGVTEVVTIAFFLYFIGVIFSPIIGLFITYYLFKDAENLHQGEIGAFMCIGVLVFTLGAVIIPPLVLIL